MAFTHAEQAVELIERAKQILIVTREHPTNDSISSAVALGLMLKNANKRFDISIPDFNAKTYPSYLPELLVRSEPGAMRAFHIKLNVSDTPLSELMYDVKDGELVMTLVPKQGEWKLSDVTTEPGRDRYDLIIAVDCPDMKSLGGSFLSHADFFYRNTIINIDHSPHNEHWGQVNLVDLNAVSTTEVLHRFFERWNAKAMNADIATALLSGMISKTKSFRTKNVTPKTLETGSRLLAAGANREEIVKRLWRVQNVSGLKLWGRVLSRLEYIPESGIAWSNLGEQDFIETGETADSLDMLIEDVLSYAPEAKTVIFFTPHPEGVRVLIHAVSPVDAGELARVFSASGNRDRAVFVYKEEGTTAEKITAILERLQLTIGKDSA